MAENTLLENEKNRFLADEFFMLSWNAAVQRNQTFVSLETKATKDRKAEFRREIKKAVFEMLPLYAETRISRCEHKKNIERLIDISKDFSDILKDFSTGEEGENDTTGKLKAGTAQKILNMMLKYCWCAGWVQMPPDMPIDKHNLDEIVASAADKEKFNISWTKDVVEIETYSALIEEIETAVNAPLSVWELIHWRRDADE